MAEYEISRNDQNISPSRANFDVPVSDVEPLPYDNEVTLLYKWADVFQTPIKYIIIRPRTYEDFGIPSGTDTLVFESLTLILNRLLNSSVEGFADIFSIVSKYKSSISEDDIVMAYYGIIRGPGNVSQLQPNLYRIINDVYREMGKSLTYDRFENNSDLDLYYNSWLTRSDDELTQNLLTLETIQYIHEKLRESESILQNPEHSINFSPFIINSTTMLFSPTIEERRVDINDGLEIFNSALISKYVPFIQYNDSTGKSFYRVYTGDKAEEVPDYSITVLSANVAKDKDTIYMTLWLGVDGDTNLHNAPRDTFSPTPVIYHLVNNYLTIESPTINNPKRGIITDQMIVHQRVQDALPILNFGEGKEIKVRGDFNIWGFQFDETSFLDLILLDPVMNVYLYVEENMTPFALKKRLDIHYRSIYTDIEEKSDPIDKPYISNSASVSITMTPKKINIDTVVDVMDPVTKSITQFGLPNGTPYVHINITKGDTQSIVDNFIRIFQLLLRYYLDNQTPIIDFYQYILPGLNALEDLLSQPKKLPTTTATSERIKKPKGESNIKVLQEYAPDLFVKNYARKCQGGQQPTIINADEIEYWENLPIGDTSDYHQVMVFPKSPEEGQQFNYICTNEQFPYPGVKINKELPNRDKYPYIPCCFKTNQIDDDNSEYSAYLDDVVPDLTVGARADKTIDTLRILKPNKNGALPKAITDILKNYSDESVKMLRYGIIFSPNSLLHCVCIAIDDPNYINQPTDESKEYYVSTIRSYISKTVYPSLLRQELYDYTDDEIISSLEDNRSFLDPALFYRAVEETFNINIYVFIPPVPDDLNDFGNLEIPRHKIFHSRPPRLNRGSILIMKNRGSESDTLPYPQCELIVDYDHDNLEIMKFFGINMTEICHGILTETLKTMTWNMESDISLSVHNNIYYYIDHLNIFQVNGVKIPAVSQFIDNDGKMRAITLNMATSQDQARPSDDRQQLLTIATLPSQPENLPMSYEVVRPRIDNVIKIFGPPTGVTRDLNNNVDGLWIQIMDLTFGEYIPVLPAPGLEDYPIGPANPILPQETRTLSNVNSVTTRIRKLRKTLNIIVQVTRWLYELARTKQAIDPNIFANQYMGLDPNPVSDSAESYDLSRLSRKFPDVETIQQALEIMQRQAPTLVGSGDGQSKIVMYNAEFADRMIKMLRDYSNLRIGMQPEYKKYIDNFYEIATDFTPLPNSKVFVGSQDLKLWLNSLRTTQNYNRFFNIRTKLNIALGFTIDPMLFRDEDGKIYIIQNPVGGSRMKALSIANVWYYQRINIGNSPEPIKDYPVHLIYAISSNSTLTAIDNTTRGSSIYVKILYYGSPQEYNSGKLARYGALLDIL